MMVRPVSFVDSRTLHQHVQGHWPAVLAAVGVDTSRLNGKHGPCPGCGGKDRFRFEDKDGRGTFFCSEGCGSRLAGDGFALLMHVCDWSFSQAAGFVRQYLGMESVIVPNLVPAKRRDATSASRGDRDASEGLNKIWGECQPLSTGDDTPLARYICQRGLSAIMDDFPGNLRLHAGLPYWLDGAMVGRFPVMIGRVQNVEGSLVGLHQTYLSPDGGKARVDGPVKKKRSCRAGSTSGCGIWLYSDDSAQLAIAEGIETALAVRGAGLTKGNLVAGVSDNGVANFVLPKGIGQVDIWADHDHAGIRAAEALANRCKSRGIAVRILLPGLYGQDWLDVLVAADQGVA